MYAGDDPINGSDPSGLTVYDCIRLGAGFPYSLIFHVYECVVPPIGPPLCYGWGGDPGEDLFNPNICYPQDNQSDCLDTCHEEQMHAPAEGYNPITNSCLTNAMDSDDICNKLCGVTANPPMFNYPYTPIGQ